jgi:hypothetical protein
LRNTKTCFQGLLVAQNFPTSAQVIYDTLAADTVFVGLIGTYTFAANNAPVPAISIVSSGENLPAVRNVQGVECVIQDAADISLFNYLTDPADVRSSWRVFLVAWDPAKGSDLQEAAERVCSRFANAYSFQTVATANGIGSLVQTMVQVYSHMPILDP